VFIYGGTHLFRISDPVGAVVEANKSPRFRLQS